MFGPAAPCSINTDPQTVVTSTPVPALPQQPLLPHGGHLLPTPDDEEETNALYAGSPTQALPSGASSLSATQGGHDEYRFVDETYANAIELDRVKRKRRLTAGSDPFVDLPADASLWRLFCQPCTRHEMWTQLKLASPVMGAYLLQLGLSLVNTMFIGRMEDTQGYGIAAYSGAGLGCSYNNVTGMAIGIGLASALDTRLSQAYTMAKAKKIKSPYKMMDPILHRFFLIMLVALLPIIALWLAAEPIQVGIMKLTGHGDPLALKLAARYTRLTIPGLLPYFVFEALKKYVQAQGRTRPILYVLIMAFAINALLVWLLVSGPIDAIRLGFDGAPIGTAIVYWLCPLMLLAVMQPLKLGKPWQGFFHRRIFQEWWSLLSVGLPGVLHIASEWWAFEICVILSGTLGNTALSAQYSIQLIASFAYMIPLGLSVAATTRVGNLIGARLPRRAKVAALASITLAILFSFANSIILIATRNVLGLVLTKERAVVELIGRVLPIVALFQLTDGFCCVAAGILRGTGRQEIGAAANLVSYYVIGLPVGLSLCFVQSVRWGIFGCWTGLCIGLFVAFTVLAVVLIRTNWEHEVKKSYASLAKEAQHATEEQMTLPMVAPPSSTPMVELRSTKA